MWLSSPELDFGGARPSRAGDERTVWLYADPFRALGLSPSADQEAVRRAYRRLAREHHPDVAPDSRDRFQEIEHAAAATRDAMEVGVEPTAGAWWRFVGFTEPGPHRDSPPAVAGLTFEIRDLHRVPAAQPGDEVRVSCGGQVLRLAITFTGSRFALPVLLARASVAAESAFLFLLCLALVPLLAALLALDVFVISNLNVFLFWGFAIVTLAAGYGALAAILAAAGRTVPVPRRAVGRTRATVARLRSLPRGHP
jgi:DnaJ domain